jgi:glycosyltransferase involved in cell wall biosynthesis
MSFDPKVSIIIPVYNGSNYLREAIDSALAQTYKNIEVIVVNDGSDDGGKTEAIAKSYRDKIRYIYKKNGGVSTALNAGILAAEGEYISWLSHDDVYIPDKLEVQINYFRNENNPVILYSDYYWIDSRSKILGSYKIQHVSPDNFLYALITSYPINGCTTLIPKSCFDTVGLFNEGLKTTQDYEMWLRLVGKYNFIHIPEPLLKSRLHPEQGTRTMSNIQLTESNNFYISCLNNFSVDAIFPSRRISKAACYIELALNFKAKSLTPASQYAFTLAGENLAGSNVFARFSENMLLAMYRRMPRVFLLAYWKLIAESLKERRLSF